MDWARPSPLNFCQVQGMVEPPVEGKHHALQTLHTSAPPQGNQALLEEEDDDLVMTPLLRAIASRDEAEYLTAA